MTMGVKNRNDVDFKLNDICFYQEKYIEEILEKQSPAIHRFCYFNKIDNLRNYLVNSCLYLDCKYV